ncbi:MAG: ferritin family protein [Bacteroidales bacterium]|jgi:rubrerythrin|nr:ferritin family protein [Bacteroidales bacterium]
MKTLDYKEILKLAIRNEIEAYEFYHSAAVKARTENLESTFRELAGEEMNHRRTLEGFLLNESLTLNFKNSRDDFKVSESVELPPLTTDMSFADGVALAMKKEEEAMDMYKKFAAASEDPGQKSTFLQLAAMEQGHKLKLEDLYTNAAFVEAW